MLTAPGLRLPATFRGDLPCADCPAIRHHLDLWPDQVFHLRRAYVGRDLVTAEIGRWHADPVRDAVVLVTGEDAPLRFAVEGAERLRLLDRDGNRIESTLPYDLSGDGTLSPADIALALDGTMTYMADAARFTTCRTGRSYPIVMEGAYLDLERAYSAAAPQPGAPVLVAIEGAIAARPRMEGAGLAPAVSVTRFVGAWPDRACPAAAAASPAALSDVYWRPVKLGDLDVTPQGGREPYLAFRPDGRYAGTAGCNRLAGGYTATGAEIAFTQGVSTRMACLPALDTAERALLSALTRARGWRIAAGALELTDETGAAVALFRAAYPP